MTKEQVFKRLDILGRQKNSFFKEMLSTNWAFCTEEQFAILLYSNALDEDADVIQRLRETMPVTHAVKKYLYNMIMNSLSGDITFTAEGYLSIIEEIFLAYIRLTENQLSNIMDAARKLDKKLEEDSNFEDFWEGRDMNFEKAFSRLYNIPEITVSRNIEFIPYENEALYNDMRTKVNIYFEASSNIFCEPFACYKPASTSIEGFVVNLFKYDFGAPIFKEIVDKYKLSFEKIFCEIFNEEDCCCASFMPFELYADSFTTFLGKNPEYVCNLYNQIIFAKDFTLFQEACDKLENKYSFSIIDFYRNEVQSGTCNDLKIATLISMIYYAPMHMFETLIRHTASIAKYDLYSFVNRMNIYGNVDFRVSIAFTNGNKEFAEKSIKYEARKNTATLFDLAITRRFSDFLDV